MQNIDMQKSEISESESSINLRTCLGHLVLFIERECNTPQLFEGKFPIHSRSRKEWQYTALSRDELENTPPRQFATLSPGKLLLKWLGSIKSVKFNTLPLCKKESQRHNGPES